MNRKETLKIMAVLKGAYSNYYKDGDIDAAVILWCDLFKDDSYKVVNAAVKSYIATDTKGFPPAIGQIKSMINKLISPEIMTEIEAWGYIKKAIRNSAYNSLEEHSKLPLIIQKIVSPEQLKDWALADLSDEQVISSNFMRSFRTKSQRESEINALPNDIKILLNQHSGNLLE